ncbi:MAG: hypothetical protein IJB11_05590, partial [Oscillospiraceae bacterium]|nr:hypothetical protein [Oscillospiraceae bacterium]
MNHICKRHVSLILATALMLSLFGGAVPGVFAAESNSAITQGNIVCNVKFSKTAICCDAGEVIDVSRCGIQFSADSPMVTEGITWSYEGAAITSFTPSAKGLYAL